MLGGGCFNQAYVFDIIKSQRFAFYFLLEAFTGDLISISSVLCGRERKTNRLQQSGFAALRFQRIRRIPPKFMNNTKRVCLRVLRIKVSRHHWETSLLMQYTGRVEWIVRCTNNLASRHRTIEVGFIYLNWLRMAVDTDLWYVDLRRQTCHDVEVFPACGHDGAWTHTV